MISYDRGLFWLATDVHYYFPEWADRPVQRGTLQESDRNSYLAGGYAEEFGYHTQLGGPHAFASLDGDPERSPLWRVQIEGLHPGYPECPRPLDRDVLQSRDFRAVQVQPSVALASSDAAYPTGEAAQRQPVPFTVIRVGERGRSERKHVRLPLARLWKEFRIRRRELGGLF